MACWVLGALTLAMGLQQAFRSGHHEISGPGWLPGFSLALAGGGILLAWAMYQRRAIDPARVARAGRGVDGPPALRPRRALRRPLPGVLLAFARLIGWLDRYLVDGVVNLLSAWTLRAGDRVRRLQTGQPQDYVYGVALGTLLLFVLAQWGLR